MQARRREREHVVKRPQPTCRIAVGPYRDAGVTVSLRSECGKKGVDCGAFETAYRFYIRNVRLRDTSRDATADTSRSPLGCRRNRREVRKRGTRESTTLYTRRERV